jgi:hypothetical protein
MEENRHDITIGQSCRDKLSMHTCTCDPHADTHPTGRYELSIRHIDTLDNKGQPAVEELACVTGPDGRCLHKLTPHRAAMLLEVFTTTRMRRPKLFKRLHAGTFVEELHRLLLRYRGSTKQHLSSHIHAATALECKMSGMQDP